MNRIETVDDLNSFMRGLIAKQERNHSGTSRMNRTPKTSALKKAKEKPKTNAAIIAEFKGAARKFNRMATGSGSNSNSQAGYDSQKARQARETRFSKDQNVEVLTKDERKVMARVGKTYGTSTKRPKSTYDPNRAKALRTKQERKIQSFANGDGPGNSKVADPGPKEDRYNPVQVRYIRAQRKINENE